MIAGVTVETRRKTVKDAIVVDDTFIERLGVLAEIARRHAIAANSLAEGLNEADIEAYISDPPPEPESNDYQAISAWRALSRKVEQIVYVSQPSYTVSFTDESSFDTNDISEVHYELKARSSEPDAITLHIGRGGSLTFMIEISASWVLNTASWRVSGERSRVADLDSRLRDFFENSNQTWPILSNRILWNGVAIILIMTMSLYVIIKTSELAKLEPDKPWIGAGVLTILILFNVFIFAPLGFGAVRVFPRVDYRFGTQHKKRKAILTLLVSFGSVIVLPLLLVPVANWLF